MGPDQTVVEFANRLQACVPVNVREAATDLLHSLGQAIAQVPRTTPTPYCHVIHALALSELRRWIHAIEADPGVRIFAQLVADIRSSDSHPGLGCLDRWRVGEPNAVRAKTEPRVVMALSFIASHCSESDLNLGRVSRHVGLSRWHLARLLRSSCGTTFTTVLKRERLALAQSLLGLPTLSVKEIAARTGYLHASELSRDFKSAFGLAPKMWRRFEQDQPASRGWRAVGSIEGAVPATSRPSTTARSSSVRATRTIASKR